MKNWGKSKFGQVDESRRKALGQLAAGGGLLAMGVSSARSEQKDGSKVDDLRFPGDEPEHKVVYQFNHSAKEYQEHVIFSVGAVLRQYGDNVKIVVTCFGPGIHILAKKPGRPVSNEIQQRVSSLNVYGVEFHACGNTMKSLKWTKKDLVEFAKVVEVGASDLIELQEKGFSYINW